MERESFMNDEVAAVLNASFIPIKIDREERPDVDDVYMNYVTATTGSGGWPLNVFLTPDLEPVFGGTYWPGPNAISLPRLAGGDEHLTFIDILSKLRTVWSTQQQRCLLSAKEITRQLKEFADEGTHGGASQPSSKEEDLELDLLDDAYTHFCDRYDATNGGFSSAPKFPTPPNLSFLLHLSPSSVSYPSAATSLLSSSDSSTALTMAITTLRHMARGGIRDQIGTGFARYSVTTDWSLPHFEKMLTDNAQLLDVYLDAFTSTRDPELLGCVLDLCSYLTSFPIAAPGGGFHSSEDADSLPTSADTEAREGAFYVFTHKEFQSLLPSTRDADICGAHYGVRADGNVAAQNDPHDELLSQNVLSVKSTPSQLAKQFGVPEDEVVKILKNGRRTLREWRDNNRPRPALDDKIVVGWNGLTIHALAKASVMLRELGVSEYDDIGKSCLEAAVRAAQFVKKEMWDDEGGEKGVLWRVWRDGRRGDVQAFADDYAFLIKGLLGLYDASWNDEWLAWAEALQLKLNADFLATGQTTVATSGFYSTSHTPSPSSPPPLLRLKSGTDAAMPSTNGIIAQNLFLLSSYLEDDSYRKLGIETCNAFAVEMIQHPFLFVSLMGAVVMKECGVKSVVVSGPRDDFVKKARKLVGGQSRTIVRVGGGAKSSWLEQRNETLKGVKADRARLLVCEAGVCREMKEGEEKTV